MESGQMKSSGLDFAENIFVLTEKAVLSTVNSAPI
jgi:hypothetical protein